MENGDGSRSESDHAHPKKAAPRFLAHSPCRQQRSLCRLPASCDELGDFLSALLADFLEVLVSVFLGNGIATDLADAAVEARPVKLLYLLPALLSDLLVEVGAVPLCGRGASAATSFSDGHRSLVSRHRKHPFSPIEVGRVLPGLGGKGGCKSYA